MFLLTFFVGRKTHEHHDCSGTTLALVLVVDTAAAMGRTGMPAVAAVGQSSLLLLDIGVAPGTAEAALAGPLAAAGSRLPHFLRPVWIHTCA